MRSVDNVASDAGSLDVDGRQHTAPITRTAVRSTKSDTNFLTFSSPAATTRRRRYAQTREAGDVEGRELSKNVINGKVHQKLYILLKLCPKTEHG